jgi:hypothetical protein
MSERPKIDRLARKGLRPHPSKVLRDDGVPRSDVVILGRRSRQVHVCAYADCGLGGKIDLDEVYIEYALGTSRFLGVVTRFHVDCALAGEIVQSAAEILDQINDRRAAIMLKRARLAKQAR